MVKNEQREQERRQNAASFLEAMLHTPVGVEGYGGRIRNPLLLANHAVALADALEARLDSKEPLPVPAPEKTPLPGQLDE